MSTAVLPVDESPVAAGAVEELAGPPHRVIAPVGQAERVSSIDVLRGFSLMGILVMNICSFAGPEWYYLFPLTRMRETACARRPWGSTLGFPTGWL